MYKIRKKEQQMLIKAKVTGFGMSWSEAKQSVQNDIIQMKQIQTQEAKKRKKINAKKYRVAKKIKISNEKFKQSFENLGKND